MKRSVQQRFDQKCRPQENGRVEFDSYRHQGYGRMTVDNRVVEAHRLAWTLAGRRLDPTLTLDHLCRNRACVNVDHLEQVPKSVNTLRGNGPTAQNARKTECVRGHPFDLKNTYLRSGGRRGCRRCGAIRTALYKARHQAERAA